MYRRACHEVFFYKKTWCICKFLHSMFERAIAFKCLEFFFFFSYSEWNAFLTDSQCTLNQKTFVMLRSFVSRNYYLVMLDKLFISNLFSSYNKMFFFIFIKIVSSFFFTSKQKINLSKFSDMGYVLIPHSQISSLLGTVFRVGILSDTFINLQNSTSFVNEWVKKL